MDGSNWVALAAVIVAGVSIVVAYLGSNRRMASEERMHTERLAHERRLVHEGNAAKAYLAVEEVQRWINWDQMEKAATLNQERLSPEAKAVIMAAVNAITEAKAYAWRDEMVTAAGMVIVTLVELEKRADASVAWLCRQLSDADPDTVERARLQFQDVWWRYDEAIEDFRRSLAK